MTNGNGWHDCEKHQMVYAGGIEKRLYRCLICSFQLILIKGGKR